MFRFLMQAISVAAPGSLLAACNSLSEESVAIAYVPSSAPAAVPGAENVSLSVIAVDKRAQLRDRIGTKRAVNTARLLAANDVIDLVRSAVEQDFKAEGFVIGSGGLTVTIDVQNFYNDFRSEGAFPSALANVAFTLRVKDGAGATLYTRFYEGNGKVENVFNQSADTAKVALQQALANAVRQVTEDQALQAVLQSARSKAAVTAGQRRS
jgi:uncharacterized lipoprotein YajG